MSKKKLPAKEIVAGLYESGMSSGEIAEMYNVSRVSVVSFMSRHGIQARPQSEAIKNAIRRGRRPTPDITGEKNPNWKNHGHSRLYRKAVQKTECAQCGTNENLGIHHVDLDHFNNAPENLMVLCVSCHMSLHKKMYWDAWRSGEKTPKSNGHVGWEGHDRS